MSARSVAIRLTNLFNQTLFLVNSNLDHGEWTVSPPSEIPAGAPCTQFGSHSHGFLTGTQGSVTYALGSPTGKQVSFSWDNPYVGSNSYGSWSADELQIGATAIGTRGDDSEVAFVVYEKLPVDWLHTSLPLLGNLPLRQICVPGSHDAGMSTTGAHTAAGWECNTRTQSRDIAGQLADGIRFFDIRPVISGGSFYTGHYSEIRKGPITTWQGANGESIADVISQINDFTQTNAELVVLYLSHDYDTDAGNSNYPPFTQDQWNALFQQLSGLSHLYVSQNAPSDLTTLKLSQFIGKGQAAVVIVVDPNASGISLGSYANHGFYPASAFPVYNSYSGTNNVDAMIADQLGKMQTQRSTSPPGYFLLSWTLTQSDTEAATCGLDPTPETYSIRTLANIADSRLYSELLPACHGNVLPNIIYVDNNCTTAIVALAATVNRGTSGSRPVTIESVAFPGVYLRMDGEGFNGPNGAGGGVVNCQFTPPGAWEQFLIETDAATGVSHIRSVAFPDCYLRMDGQGFNAPNGAGGGVVNCQFTPPGPWEQFLIETDATSGESHIRSVAFPDCYLRMDGNGVSVHTGAGAGEVNCQYTPPGPWEKFVIKPVG